VLKDALQQIRLAEEEAAEIVAGARHEANQLRERTARDLRGREEAALQASAARRRERMDEAEERGRRKAADLLEVNRGRIGKLRQAAETRRPEAVQAIVRRLIG
jgi:vacuolar-type H+-ATPase subunit H